MKKVVSLTGEAIDFLVSGQRHSRNAVEYHIDEEGVIVSDDHAAILSERLGGQIMVETITVKEAKDSLKGKATKEDKKNDTEEGEGEGDK